MASKYQFNFLDPLKIGLGVIFSLEGWNSHFDPIHVVILSIRSPTKPSTIPSVSDCRIDIAIPLVKAISVIIIKISPPFPRLRSPISLSIM
ncbi:hypothetical protein LguiA_021822 [Lonicera macranthoides]